MSRKTQGSGKHPPLFPVTAKNPPCTPGPDERDRHPRRATSKALSIQRKTQQIQELFFSWGNRRRATSGHAPEYGMHVVKNENIHEALSTTFMIVIIDVSV